MKVLLTGAAGLIGMSLRPILASRGQRSSPREYNIGSGEALTMPEIVNAAERVLAGMRTSLVPGADDVPDIQTIFDISSVGRDLGWTPRFRIAGGLASYRDAVRASDASP